jgi:hypothetical protein
MTTMKPLLANWFSYTGDTTFVDYGGAGFGTQEIITAEIDGAGPFCSNSETQNGFPACIDTVIATFAGTLTSSTTYARLSVPTGKTAQDVIKSCYANASYVITNGSDYSSTIKSTDVVYCTGRGAYQPDLFVLGDNPDLVTSVAAVVNSS